AKISTTSTFMGAPKANDTNVPTAPSRVSVAVIRRALLARWLAASSVMLLGTVARDCTVFQVPTARDVQPVPRAFNFVVFYRRENRTRIGGEVAVIGRPASSVAGGNRCWRAQARAIAPKP